MGFWKRQSIRRGLLCAALLGACAQAPSSGAEAQATAPAAATTPAQKLVSQYLVVQRKLSADDQKAAQAGFAQLKTTADATELPGDPALRKRLGAAAASGAAAKDLEAGRAAFGKLSEALLEWLKQQGNPLTTSVRIAHCPMAADGKGARWVQSEPKLANPYFGSEMLTCGSIESEIKPGAKPKT